MASVTEEQRRADDIPFLEAIGKSAGTEQIGYLGDQSIVDGLLRNAASEFFERLGGDQEIDVEQAIVELSAPLALAFLGVDPDYAAVRGWNKPGAIDAFVAKWCGVDETDPRLRITGGVAAMLGELIDLANYAGTPGVLDEQWKPQADAIFQRYVGIFMGISPPTMATL